MMPPLPALSGREVVRSFVALGWKVARQRGSHVILVKEGHIATLSVPDHRIVAKGTLRALIRAADLTVSEFASTVNRPH
ncbi:MAG: type II toxin-antitoxin system HicA family toxin [Actinobacteria bacterium]|nr:type II toxin-antitoxin system HicA family toxin [Actinomycetota bacterium]